MATLAWIVIAATWVQGQAPRTASSGLRRESTIPAPRLLFYSLMLGEQPEGVLTWYGMVEPLLEQEQIQAARQRQIEDLQARLNALRAAQARESQRGLTPALPRPQPLSSRAAPGLAQPPRRPAAGFQRYGSSLTRP